MRQKIRKSKLRISLKGVDLQDCLMLAGIANAETAAVVIWWPAALILACLFCFGFVVLIELGKKAKEKAKP